MTQNANRGHDVGFSIKKKVKGGGGPGGTNSTPGMPVAQQPGGQSVGFGHNSSINTCKTLPNNSHQFSTNPTGNNALNKNASLKLNRSNSADPHGEAISSAIVKYNYQAQQLDELSLGEWILIMQTKAFRLHPV